MGVKGSAFDPLPECLKWGIAGMLMLLFVCRGLVSTPILAYA